MAGEGQASFEGHVPALAQALTSWAAALGLLLGESWRWSCSCVLVIFLQLGMDSRAEGVSWPGLLTLRQHQLLQDWAAERQMAQQGRAACLPGLQSAWREL